MRLAITASVFCVCCVFFYSCNFNKTQPDEIVSLTDEVLKKQEGIDIQIRPIPKDKK